MRRRLREAGRALAGGLVELLYPARCFSCAGATSEPGLCSECEATLQPVRAPFCSICGEPYEGEIDTAFRCSNCTGRDYGFDFAIAGYLAGWIRG